jgi:hypothetical protein
VPEQKARALEPDIPEKQIFTMISVCCVLMPEKLTGFVN